MAQKHRMKRSKKIAMPKPMNIVTKFSKTLASTGDAFKKEFRYELDSATKQAKFGKKHKR
jgi:hypothetical protein